MSWSMTDLTWGMHLQQLFTFPLLFPTSHPVTDRHPTLTCSTKSNHQPLLSIRWVFLSIKITSDLYSAPGCLHYLHDSVLLSFGSAVSTCFTPDLPLCFVSWSAWQPLVPDSPWYSNLVLCPRLPHSSAFPARPASRSCSQFSLQCPLPISPSGADLVSSSALADQTAFCLPTQINCFKHLWIQLTPDYTWS